MKPLHTYSPFDFSGNAGIARFCTQSLDFNPFHSCGDAAKLLRCQLLRRMLVLARMRLAQVEALFDQSSNGLDWRSVLHALPETMPVRAMRRILPTFQNGLSVLFHDGLNWYVEQAIKSSTARSHTAWHWNFSSMHCMPRHLKVAPDDKLPDDRENCLHQKCAPTSCFVWSPSSTSIKRKVQAKDCKGRLSVVAFQGELLSFSSFRSNGCVLGAAALQQRTYAQW